MTGQLQSLIEQANRKTQATRNRQFVKKASDSQMLNQLTAAGREYLDAVQQHGATSVVATGARSKLKLAVSLSEKRVK